MSYTRDWSESSPADHTKFKVQPQGVREAKTDIAERLKNMFYGFTAGETEEGVKKLIFLADGTNAASSALNAIVPYAKDVNSKPELHIKDEDGNEIQMSSAGGLIGGKTYEAVGNDDIGGTGAAWADIADMSITQTFPACNALIAFTAPMNVGNVANEQYRILVDGVQKVHSRLQHTNALGSTVRVVTMQKLEVLTAGSHTIKVQWYNTTGQNGSTDGERILTVQLVT